ncbi:hypothetical protein EVAR_66202_1 [Eumeta japonica]|uniref:Uncharacterized protein n=1 Tax=Eumeta variegata TaxID=151549 RepID=A0A4C1ZGM4_EUMVA|nr:hypothetical protein EVAR_66202_1 [Eumeta japonica]
MENLRDVTRCSPRCRKRTGHSIGTCPSYSGATQVAKEHRIISPPRKSSERSMCSSRHGESGLLQSKQTHCSIFVRSQNGTRYTTRETRFTVAESYCGQLGCCIKMNTLDRIDIGGDCYAPQGKNTKHLSPRREKKPALWRKRSLMRKFCEYEEQAQRSRGRVSFVREDFNFLEQKKMRTRIAIMGPMTIWVGYGGNLIPHRDGLR